MNTVRTDISLLEQGTTLNSTIGEFWDKVSPLWDEIWGPHIHHGYYDGDNSLSPIVAQERLIEKLLERLKPNSNISILDVGCGMGGSSIYLSDTLKASVKGITLSPIQIEIAQKKVKAAGLENVTFALDDALKMETIEKESVDLVWSLESCEQFPDKPLFLQQAFDRLKPGGTLMLATWCSSEDSYSGKNADKYIKLCESFDLPYMPTIDFYKNSIEQTGFTLTEFHNWAPEVEASWDLGISKVSALSLMSILFRGGLRSMQFVKQLPLMQKGFKEKRVQYGVFIATKS